MESVGMSGQSRVLERCVHECKWVCGHLQSYQRMEGGNGEDAQSSHGQLGGTRGEAQQALGVGGLAALQTGQVAAAAEQIHVKPLQVLLPQEDLTEGNV